MKKKIPTRTLMNYVSPLVLLVALMCSGNAYGQTNQGKIVKELLGKDSSFVVDLEKQVDTLKKALLEQNIIDSIRKEEINKYAEAHIRDTLYIVELQKQLADTITANVINAFGKECKNADEVFCSFLLEYPLYYAYNESLVSQCLERARLLGYSDKKNKYHLYYEIYEPLLNNYAKYTEDLVQAIDDVINDIKNDKNINRTREKDRFLSTLYGSRYYKVKGSGKYGQFKHIVYLDYRISRIIALFDSDKDFKIKNFQEERKKLQIK